MAEYGITDYTDEDMLYIRRAHCATSLRVRKEVLTVCKNCETFWNVEVSGDNENWQSVYVFGDRDSAFIARDRLAEFIEKEAV